MPHDSRYDDLHALCAADLAHWRERWRADPAAYLRTLDELNASRSDLFVLDIEQGTVRLRDKPAQTGGTRHLLKTRVPAYLAFFGRIASHLAPELTLSVGLVLEDCAQGDPRIPLLGFQKTLEDNLLLVPDIDTLALHFYDDPEFVDALDYRAKRASAIFVGSTTGVDPRSRRAIVNTRQGIDQAPAPRIRAARYFAGREHITFRLPGVVQCDNARTEAYLRSLEFCQGGHVSWQQQYHHRFLISLDGNGATCSRLALALRSRCVLLKYASPYVLFYTRALVPRIHYLPVEHDGDVVNYVALLNRPLPGRPYPFEAVSRNADLFYRRYLSKPAQHRYAAVVLGELHGLLHGEAPPPDIRRRIDDYDAPLDITAHLGELGDQWCWPGLRAGTPGSGQAIEAFSVTPTDPETGDDDIEYQGLFEDDSLSPWTPGGTLCGQRDQHRRLAGLRLRLPGALGRRRALRYRATFAGDGGAGSGWTAEGQWCASPARAPLESFDVELLPR